MTRPREGDDVRYDVVGIGNALVDVLSHENDELLTAEGLVKGSMNLIEADDAVRLYRSMGPAVEVSGGSAANTMVGIASFGGRAAYVGKVHDDQLGEVFRHDLTAAGVAHVVELAPEGAPTGRCLIMVTPDAQRTMNTYLGASVELTAAEVDAEAVTSARAVYLEGYLWDRPDPQEAMLKVARLARESGALVSLTLSDSFCVDRHRESFRTLIDAEVDLLFANEDELMALYEVDELEAALDQAAEHVAISAVTRGPLGSIVVEGPQRHEVPAVPVATLVDTTGAGDQYAAGFLYGLTQGRDLPTCAHLGSAAAAEVISHLGPRPERPYRDLIS